MLGSLFVLNKVGEVLIEKHWKSVLSRTVSDSFWTEVTRKERSEDVPPIMEISQRILVHVYRCGLYFVAVLNDEAPPLLVLELLHRFIDLLEDYFPKFSQDSLRSNFVVVYQLLEEFIDSGFPFVTEPAVLKELVPPPGVFNRGGAGQSRKTEGGGTRLPEGTMSAITWRKQGIRYGNNEVFFDIVEEVDAIVDVSGMVVRSEVSGKIHCRSKLSGMPEVLLSFIDSNILDDCSFHPCVRYSKYETDRSLSFIPPDGAFVLMSYRVNTGVQLPLYVKPQVSFNESGGRLHMLTGMRAGAAPMIPKDGAVEDVAVTMPLPEVVENVTLTVQGGGGAFQFDQKSKTLSWKVGKMTAARNPSLNGTLTTKIGAEVPDYSLAANVSFRIPGVTLSGLRIDSVNVVNEKYKCFKGVRSVTKSGDFQVRT